MNAERCEVCWLPASKFPCSERCRGLTEKKRQVRKLETALQQAVLLAIGNLPPSSTCCPGVLAERLLKEQQIVADARDSLALLREIYFKLRAGGKIRFLQKGVVIPPGKDFFRGPFRLGKR